MPTLLSGISVALQAMLASQQAIRTTENNVANANTPGYHRQQTVMKAARAYPSPGLYTSSANAGQIGAGVEAESIQRFNTDFLDASVRRETAASSYWSGKADLLRAVEVQVMEVKGSGLISEMDAFWDGWRSLESDPTNSTLRTDLLEKTRSLADGFKSRLTHLKTLRTDLNQRLEPLVTDVNSHAERVAELNKEILAVQSSGNQPNDLIDERSRLLEDLSRKIGATTNFFSNGQAQVMVGTHVLVSSSSSSPIAIAPDAAGLNQLTWKSDGSPVGVSRGEVGAILEARDQIIVGQIKDLNTVATALIHRVNNVHRAGFGLNNSTGNALFTGTNAEDIALNAALTTDDIAAAAAVNSPGDGSIAKALADVQNERLLTDDMVIPDPIPANWPVPNDAGNSLTLQSAYNNRITQLGLDIKAADKNASSRQLVLETLEQQRDSISGVSLDEEAANLVAYQRTYQAAARLMTALDEMIDRVINGMGRVGL